MSQNELLKKYNAKIKQNRSKRVAGKVQFKNKNLVSVWCSLAINDEIKQLEKTFDSIFQRAGRERTFTF